MVVGGPGWKGFATGRAGQAYDRDIGLDMG